MKIIMTAVITVALLFLQSFVFGVNDSWVLSFVVPITLLIWLSVDKLHAGNRKMLRVKAKENSRLYAFLSRKRNPVMLIFGLFSSVILSGVLLMVIKGLVRQHGEITVIIGHVFK